MDNYNNENFRDDWTRVGTPVYKSFKENTDDISDILTNDTVSKDTKRKIVLFGSVVSLQLIICLLVLIFSYICSAFFADKFKNIKEIYDDEIYASMLFDGNLEDVDYSSVFTAKNKE